LVTFGEVVYSVNNIKLWYHIVALCAFIHLLFSNTDNLRTLHSFPTRRSSDLLDEAAHPGVGADARQDDQLAAYPQHAREFIEGRSEEHTSELQSQSNLVCGLLLEKKKYHVGGAHCSITPLNSFTSQTQLQTTH